MTPWPGLRSRAWSGAHMLLIKSSAWLHGSRGPGPGQALVTPGARARLQGRLPNSEIKLTPKSAWGPRGRGDQKGKGPGGGKGALVPFAGEELAGFPPCLLLTPTPLTLPTSSSP